MKVCIDAISNIDRIIFINAKKKKYFEYYSIQRKMLINK